jgi:hypothetical protein
MYIQKRKALASSSLQSFARRVVTRGKYIVLLKVSRAAQQLQESAAKAEAAKKQEALKANAVNKDIKPAQPANIQVREAPVLPSAGSSRSAISSQVNQERVPPRIPASGTSGSDPKQATKSVHDAALDQSVRSMMQSASSGQKNIPLAPMGKYGTLGSNGWVSMTDGVWLECELLDQSDTHLTLRLSSGVQTVDRRTTQFFLRNPENVEIIDDFLQLPYLDEPNILNSLVRMNYYP